MISIQNAIDALYRIAVTEDKATSTTRLDTLADFCVQELVYRLGISLKSLLKNLGGTVPNRIDDLIGEVANAQLHSPEIVIGYIMIFNVAEDTFTPKHGSTWSDLFRNRLQSLSGRRSPSWTTGTVEDFVLVEVDFSSGSSVLVVSQPFNEFFDTLVDEISARNPNAL